MSSISAISPAINYNLSVIGDQPYPSFELRNIIRYLNQESDLGSAELLNQINLSSKDLEQDFIPAFKMLEAFSYCSEHLGPLAGAKIGTTYEVKDLGVFGYAIASCHDLEHAIFISEKYNSLIGNLLKRGERVEDNVLITRLYNIQNIDEDCVKYFVAQGTSARLHIARSIFGDDLNFKKVSFTFNDQANQAAYEAIYGCPVVFDAEYNAYELDMADLRRQRKDGNHDDVTRFLPYCNEVLASLRQKDSLVNEIQQILVSCSGDYPDIEMLASAFKVSSRTLRRQLSHLGTSYQKILNKVRCQLSIEYLTKTDITIEDISNLIGFSDVTNFRHAFKKWVGKTPSFYRKTYQ